MSYIARRLADPHRRPPDPALALFHATRRAAALALMAWLNTKPDADDVTLEVHGTTEIFRQLAQLARGAAQ
jgi:hypothetical protein